jgi:hypothetical protein
MDVCQCPSALAGNLMKSNSPTRQFDPFTLVRAWIDQET